MKANVLSLTGAKMKKIDLPIQFEEDIREDLVKRAVLAIHSHGRQPYGADPKAGMKTSAKHIARRKKYGSWANKGMARLKRIRVGSGYLTGRGRFVPFAVKGRRAHPPKAEKIWDQKINAKEKRKAIRSAIASTTVKEIVKKRGHRIDELSLPLIVENKFENLKKTSEVKKYLEKIGCKDDLERCSVKTIRSGKGKMRGRKYKKKKGPLLVISEDRGIVKAGKNIPGVDIISVRNLNAEILAPGAKIGRLSIWTEGAIETLNKEKLFM